MIHTTPEVSPPEISLAEISSAEVSRAEPGHRPEVTRRRSRHSSTLAQINASPIPSRQPAPREAGSRVRGASKD